MPNMDECAAELEDSCNSFIREDCLYSGDVVFNKTSVTDAHSCQALLQTLGAIYKAEYFVYDSIKHKCVFYTSRDSACNGFSGPALPDIDDCNAEGTTAAPTAEPTEGPTEQPTEGPTEETTEQPTEEPTEQPTEEPTVPPFIKRSFSGRIFKPKFFLH